MPIVLNSVTNTDKLSLINSNFQKIEDAINDSLLWRVGNTAGEAQMERPLDMNNGQLLNALVGNLRLSALAEDLTSSVINAANSAISASTSESNALASATSASSSAASASSSANSAASSASSIAASAAQIATNTSNISSLQTRMSAEEAKVNRVALGGTGATTAVGARTSLGAAASGANTDITSITGSAATLTTPRTVQTNLASTTAASFNGSANISPGVTGTLPIANGGTGNTTGLAATATALATSRTIQTNLGSTSAASFNGTANVSPGVTGTLPVANGGTGASTASAALTSLGAMPSTGNTTGTDAAAGTVGEYLTASSTGTSQTSNTAANITSLSLTAGDWEIQGVGNFTAGSGSSVSVLALGINTASATFPGYADSTQLRLSFTGGAGVAQTISTPTVRVNSSTPVTIYLVSTPTFSGGTLTADGTLKARRRR